MTRDGGSLRYTCVGYHLTSLRPRGVPFGRPPKLRPDQRTLARNLIEEGQSVSDIARTFNVHVATIYRCLHDEATQMTVHRSARAHGPLPGMAEQVGQERVTDALQTLRHRLVKSLLLLESGRPRCVVIVLDDASAL